MRVIEEYFRFLENNESVSVEIKQLRHQLQKIESAIGAGSLLRFRDTSTDCFADECRPEELNRSGETDVLRANFKRSQEASRVLEEYVKISDRPQASEIAKKVRFSLYSMEKRVLQGK